jgi:aminopeptidase N
MPGSENLTRAEAATRATQIHVHGYEVELDLTGTGPTFPSRTRVTFDCTEPGLTSWIDLIAPRVTSVTLNGTELDPAEVFHDARITLPDLGEHNELTVVADCAYMNTGEGLHRFVDPVDNETYLYTQFESADARRVFACFEQPDLKGTFTLTVTAPKHWQVVSNAPTPTPVPVDANTARWSFPEAPRMSTYITALVAGPYASVHDSYTGTYGTYPLGLYCRTSLAPFLDHEEIFTVTKQGFEFFEEQFGMGYPFSKYDQLFVPEFNAGAMENAGCVTILEDYIFRSRVTDAAYEQRANTILHELAHMWFGDLVTMTWWDDLWLNESFAEWAAHHANVHATRYTDAWTTFANLRKSWAYRQDQLPSTHPIAADMVDLDSVRVNFDGITYAKGASALRQLVAWVGETEFLAGIQEYFRKHAWGNTELNDLLVELSAASGRDLSGWTREWLQTSGVNLLQPVVEVDEDGNYTSVSIRQDPPATPDGVEQTLRSHRIALGLYDVTDAGLHRRERLEIDVVGADTPVPELTGVRQPDLLLVNDDDLTFAKIRLDERSWRTATAKIGQLDSSLARAILWSAAWDMTRDAEVSTGDYLTLVISGIGSESDVGVVQGVLRQMRTAIDVYAAPGHRGEYSARLASATHTFATSAPPGSDHQLAFTRAFIASATTDAQLGVVAGLYDGTMTWEGLEVDTDLRWFLLQRLVAAGQREDDAIEAELARDDTATGRRHAALARASRPTPAAKELAWGDILHRTDLPNALVDATIAGFMQAEQTEILRPFRERYFAELAGVWAARTFETAQSITMGLYPMLLVDSETVEATKQYLAEQNAATSNPAARRLLVEGLDGIERAMRTQKKDAGN